MAKLISKTYGDALLELAVEENKLDNLSTEIKQLITIFEENQELLNLLNHPRISVEEKVTLLSDVFKGRLDEELLGFLMLIVKKGRSSNIKEILSFFLDGVKELKGIGVVYVFVPMEISDKQKKEVEDKILATTDYNELEMHFEIKPELIGGMQIRIGDRVVDSSVQTKIAKLQQELLKIQL